MRNIHAIIIPKTFTKDQAYKWLKSKHHQAGRYQETPENHYFEQHDETDEDAAYGCLDLPNGVRFILRLF
jgi:hypothetical protein